MTTKKIEKCTFDDCVWDDDRIYEAIDPTDAIGDIQKAVIAFGDAIRVDNKLIQTIIKDAILDYFNSMDVEVVGANLILHLDDNMADHVRVLNLESILLSYHLDGRWDWATKKGGTNLKGEPYKVDDGDLNDMQAIIITRDMCRRVADKLDDIFRVIGPYLK